MRTVRVLLPAFLGLALAGVLTARTARAEDQPSGIRVRGQGVITARPDVAFLGIGASVRRDSAGEAFNRAEQLIGAVTDSLKANGIAERDIQTRQFSLSPEYGRSNDNSPPPVIGWRATHTLSVKVRDFGRIGKTIDDAVAMLGNDAQIQGITFAIEDTDALASRARAEAIQNARDKAEEMAARAGVRVGKLLFLQEVSSPPPTPVPAAQAGVALRAATPAPVADISPGELTVNVIVEAIFAIE